MWTEGHQGFDPPGDNYTVLLQNDGTAVAFGLNDKGQCDIPPLDAARPYTQVSAGYVHTVLLRNDGSAVACGQNDQGQCSIPACDPEISYVQVSAGGFHTVLLKSDGSALACGGNDAGQCNIPPLDEGVSYTQVSAGYVHTVLLRSDGLAVACGSNKSGQCNTGSLPPGISYTQVSAGKEHTVFLRSDGSAVASGRDLHGQGRIPPLRKRMTYTQVSAGGDHTVLLQSDGTAVAVGMNSDGQCIIPSLTSRLESFSPSSKRYIPDRAAPVRSDRILQLDFQCDNDVVNLIFCTLAGQEVLHLKANGTDLAFDLYKRISREFGAWITGNLEDFGCLFWEVTQNVGQICHWKSMSFPLEMMDPLDGGIPIAILVYWRISFYPWFYQVFVSIHHVFVSSVPLECPFIGILGDFQLWVLG